MGVVQQTIFPDQVEIRSKFPLGPVLVRFDIAQYSREVHRTRDNCGATVSNKQYSTTARTYIDDSLEHHVSTLAYERRQIQAETEKTTEISVQSQCDIREDAPMT